MLKFLCGKNNFLTPAPNCFLCNVLIQPPFDYTCSAWHPVLIRKLKHRIHTTQIKCIRFCLYFDNLKHISHEEFEHLNWLPVTYKFKKSVSSIFFKYFIDQDPSYMNKVFDFTTETNLQFGGNCHGTRTNVNNSKLECSFTI